MRRLLALLFIALFGSTGTALAQPHIGPKTSGGTGSRGVLPSSAKGVTNPSAIIDLTPIFAPAINDRYDADGSKYSTVAGVPGGTDDFISLNESGIPCSATECVLALPVASPDTGTPSTLRLPSNFRYLVCRDSSGFPWAPCSGTGGPGTCTSTLAATSYDRAFPIVVYRSAYNLYKVHAIVAATSAECQGTGTFTVTVTPNIHYGGYTTSDFVAPFYSSGIHYSTYGSRAIGDFIASATVESTRIPRTAELPGQAAGVGTMETACTGIWTRTGTGTIAQTVPVTASYVDPDARQSVWGNGCKLSGSTASGDYLQSPAFTTVAGGIYTIRFFMREDHAAFSLSTVALTNAADVYDFSYGPDENTNPVTRGWKGQPIGYLVGCQGWNFDGMWHQCILKFRATSTTSQLRVGINAASQAVYIDEVYAFLSDLQTTSELEPLFDAGPNSVTFDGDSQLESTVAGVAGRLTDGLAWAFAQRSTVQMTCPFPACARGVSGTVIADLVDMTVAPAVSAIYGLQRYRTKRPSIAIAQSYINDVANAVGPTWGGTAPATPDTGRSTESLVGAVGTVGAYADLAVWLTPQPYGFASGASTNVCTNYECGQTSNKIVTALLHSLRVGW